MKDGGGPSLGEFVSHEQSVFVLVTVEDVANKDPTFSNLPNSATVSEGSAIVSD